MSESVDDIEIDEEGLGGVEAVEEVFAEFEEESERYARTVEQYEESSPQSGMDSNYGSYDRETGSIYLDGMELQGSDDKIEGIKEKFKEGFEGLADWSEGEWNGVTYRTDYHIEGSTLRLDTYVIEVNEAVSLDSGTEQDDSSDGGDENELPAASRVLETEVPADDSQEIVRQENEAGTESIQEVTAWSSWLGNEAENTARQEQMAEVAQAENPIIIERPLFSFDSFTTEDENTAQMEASPFAAESKAEKTSEPEQYLFEEADLSVHIEHTSDTSADSIVENGTLAKKPEANEKIFTIDSPSPEAVVLDRVPEAHTAISLKKEGIKQTESSASRELPKPVELQTAESGADLAIETGSKIDSTIGLESRYTPVNEEMVQESTFENINVEGAFVEKDKVNFSPEHQPISVVRNTKGEVKISLSEEAPEKDISVEGVAEPGQITAELSEATVAPEETHVETDVAEIMEIRRNETLGIKLASAEKQELTRKETGEKRQIETQREQKVLVEQIQKTTERIEKKITEVRRAIRLVKAETKKIEQVARERTQAEKIYEPIREIRRVIINGPRLETGGITLRRNRAVISTEERDRLENANRIVEIPRYNSRRRTPNRSSAIRLAA